jgi:outer membrane protein
MMRSLTTVLLLLGAVNAASAQVPPLRLTLDEAIARGIETSPRLEELTARQESARAIEDQREADGLPQISALAGYTRINHVEEFGVPNAEGGFRTIIPDLPNRTQSRLDLQWPIYTGGRLSALTRAAGAEVEATEQDREAARADLKLEITRSFLAVTTSRASADVVRQALERTSAHLNDVRNQLSVGLVPPSDVLTIEAQQAHQRMLSIEAETLVVTTIAEFKRLVGVDQAVSVELIPSGNAGAMVSPPRPGDPPAPANVVMDEARASRPERKSLLFRINAAEERVAAASAGRLPMLTAAGGYDVARPNLRIFSFQDKWAPSWDVGVSVRWSLFDGGRVRAETAEAAANRRAVEAQLRNFDAGVEVEVRQRTAELTSANAAIEAAGVGVRAAAEARRVIAERFSAGVATNMDVLDAQTALLQAELDLTRARASAQLATARLDRALGR